MENKKDLDPERLNLRELAGLEMLEEIYKLCEQHPTGNVYLECLEQFKHELLHRGNDSYERRHERLLSLSKFLKDVVESKAPPVKVGEWGNPPDSA